jgi:uncharacterized protein YjdB
MKLYHSFLAASLFAIMAAGAGCGSTSDVTDDGKAVSGLAVTPDQATLSKGASMQFHAMLQYADGTTKDVSEDSDTVWNSSNPDIATVSKDGMVKGVDVGVVDISAMYNGEIKGNEHFAVTP